MAEKGRWHLAAIWIAGAALSAPIGIVLHELAHYSAATAFGLPGVSMNYASINIAGAEEFWSRMAAGNRAGAAEIAPLHQIGIVTILGPLSTVVLSLAAALLLRAKPDAGLASALLAGLALTAGVRSLTGLFYIVHVRSSVPDASPNFDEFNAARAFNVPVDFVVWPMVLGLVLCWLIALPHLRPHLAVKLPAVLIGTAVGIAIWFITGPLLLG